MEFNADLIANIITFADKTNGELFGGYVRDIIIPCKINVMIGDDFKDIDIWFQEQEDADNFVDAIKNNYQVKNNYGYDVKAGTVEYTFARKQYAIMITESFDLWIDVVVSKKFPVDDFDVNCFVYSNGRFYLERDDLNENEVLLSIIDRTMTMLPGYRDKLMHDSHGDVHRCRISNRYLEKGWKIKYNEQILPAEISWWRNERNDPASYQKLEISSDIPPVSKPAKDPFVKTILDETDDHIVYYQGGDDRQIYNMIK